MKKISFLFIFICVNILFAFLLIHKQNKIMHYLYDFQKLQEQKKQLLENKKNLMLELQTNQQLSGIQTFATKELGMQPISLKDAKIVQEPKEQ